MPSVGDCGSTRLEVKLQSELNHPRIVHSVTHHGETAGGVYILHSATATRQVELSMVKEVEELSPEVKSHSLVGQWEMFDYREIRVHKPWSIQRRAVRVSKLAGGRVGVCARVEPILKRPHAIWRASTRRAQYLTSGIRVRGDYTRLPRITYLIGPV